MRTNIREAVLLGFMTYSMSETMTTKTNREFILETALQTLRIEQETLRAMEASIDARFLSAVEAIFTCSGRLVVSGIGKSALIGQKIVATLNSTGTPAVYMHAADAIHGDLGMIQSEDLVMCLSKSGETSEIKVLVPLLLSRGTRLIGMTANEDSYLGQRAHFLLHTPVPKEADPNNLAPTASTTAQAAMGDALATALLAWRGFSARDFARFHPGGALGKQLYLRVSDLLHLHERPAVSPEATLREVILEMTAKRLGATVVVSPDNEIVGIVTDGDLRRMLEQGDLPPHLNATEIMTPGPKSIDAEALAVDALELMQSHKITQLPVTEHGKYTGMVHLHDLLREGLL